MKKLSFPLLFLGLAHCATAQTNAQSEAFWTGTLTTVTTGQQAALTNSPLVPTSTDQVILLQQGNNNQVNYVNTGVQLGNRVGLTQQGDGNRLSLSANGSQNNYLLEQLGSGNELQLNAVRGNDAQLQVRQTGNNNSLISTGMPFGGLALPIKIEQSGGARAIITSTY
ncbi:hypothetical protein J2I47_13125 [Fibrella sp. HMF5335]|uniref:Curlin associated repeat-containing protein n=1 Tax=Fibrella rubiginis TaxID=2817060 RepID=A0A939K1T7_9BACT|nr:hypothetical protein [Fibrella rubiginis]MBO0937492.1 hypothetical protein [Fibrella rubiginis]